jgi:hypothetical protein
MTTHPHLQTIARYFKGCNTADTDLMVACFTENVEAYFIAIPPIVGSRKVAKFWCRLHEGMGALWTVDRGIAEGTEAVVEWSMLWTPSKLRKDELWRGTDWFKFENDRIAEIRQYYHAPDINPGPTYNELQGYPYAERGYPSRENLNSRLPR